MIRLPASVNYCLLDSANSAILSPIELWLAPFVPPSYVSVSIPCKTLPSYPKSLREKCDDLLRYRVAMLLTTEKTGREIDCMSALVGCQFL